MRYSEPEKLSTQTESTATLEDRLRKENHELKRQIQELRGSSHHGPPTRLWHPSGVTIGAILLAAGVLIVIAFLAGYLPRQKRMTQIVAESREQAEALPRVDVVEVGRSAASSGLQVPGNIQAITEAPILARADGYLGRRFADIGDRVKAGQPLAEIEAPELDAQVRQAKANVQQAQAALGQALANLEQGKTDMELARVTSERWTKLASEGVVSRQDNDQYQAQYRSRAANVQALEKAILVQRSNIAAAEANVARLEKIQSYRIVRAPFDGVITLRNVDSGALVSAGSTLLFRIGQTGSLRAYVNVPQTYASFVRVGQTATVEVSNLPGRQFKGTVVRSASALDPTSRTLLVELNVPNKDNALLPGMYAQIDLNNVRAVPPVIIPSDALVVRADGTQVAVVRADHTVHLQKIEVARDYGDRLEVSSGLQQGESIIMNAGDAAREGLKVDPVPLEEKTPPKPTSAR